MSVQSNPPEMHIEAAAEIDSGGKTLDTNEAMRRVFVLLVLRG